MSCSASAKLGTTGESRFQCSAGQSGRAKYQMYIGPFWVGSDLGSQRLD
jgi:hypothetical protein